MIYNGKKKKLIMVIYEAQFLKKIKVRPNILSKENHYILVEPSTYQIPYILTPAHILKGVKKPYNKKAH